MKAVKEILAAYGYDSVDEMDVEDSVSVESPGLANLVIEKTWEDQLSVAHYYSQRGDLMRDPEIVFDVSGDEWVPIEFTQDPMTYQYDEDGLDLDGFPAQWSENLYAQRFVERAQDAAREEEMSDG